MAKRVCYIHIGPHKTGSSAIQWFLKEHRAELMKQGYFVPESGTLHGGHHPLVRKLCGQQLPDHQESAAVKFTRALAETACEAVVISSEALDTLLRNSHHATEFFNRIEQLNLAPKLVVFPRNQSQAINSRYTEVVKSFRCAEPFGTFVQWATRRPSLGYALLIELANVFHADLIPRPFTSQTAMRGVVPEFLRAIGLDSSSFSNTEVRHNQSVGPFTISVARCVWRLIVSPNTQLTWLQAERCKKGLAAYLNKKGWADAGYCGLTSVLARSIETAWEIDNDLFARRMWDRRWTDVFAADTNQGLMPNDFDLLKPNERTQRQLNQAVGEMTIIAQEIMRDSALAVAAPWNDLRQRHTQGRTCVPRFYCAGDADF